MADSTEGEHTGLHLYHTVSSGNSQKVVIALHEKKQDFKETIIVLANGDHIQPCFVKMNPKAQVPVLKDGDKIIVDSPVIVRYLDEKFKNVGDPLIPRDPEEARKAEEFETLLSSVPVGLILFGCVFFPELAKNCKMPEEEKKRRSSGGTVETVLEELEKKYPQHRALYSEKKAILKKFSEITKNKEVLLNAFSELEKKLDLVENEFARHGNDIANWWLCSEYYTLPDIILTLILHTLEYSGFWYYFFDDNKRPHLQEFYKRVQKRDSFKKTYFYG